MVNAAVDILRPDGSVIKKGEKLSDELVFEFERSSPQLLDCYVTRNSQYFKKVGKKLIPHSDVLANDSVEVKMQPGRKVPKAKPKKKEISYSKEEIKDMNRELQERILKKRGIEFSYKDKEKDLIKKIFKSNPK